MRKPIACSLVRNRPEYRRDVVLGGLAKLGFDVTERPNMRPQPQDLLIIWNRYGQGHALARNHEKNSAVVMVIENGYLPMRKAKKTFALALKNHNGAGYWHVGDESRAPMLDIELKPWQGDGTTGDILLLPQRGVGPPGVAMPRNWVADVRKRMQKAGVDMNRVRVREHPGKLRSPRSLKDDVAAAGLCIVWASSAGIKALVQGCPVVHELPRWIASSAASFGVDAIRAPRLGDREQMLERLAWAQWSDKEIATGLPFEHLLEHHERRKK